MLAVVDLPDPGSPVKKTVNPGPCGLHSDEVMRAEHFTANAPLTGQILPRRLNRSRVCSSMYIAGKRIAVDIDSKKRNRVKAHLPRTPDQFRNTLDVLVLQRASCDDSRPLRQGTQCIDAGSEPVEA